MKTLIKSLALALSLGFVTTATTFADDKPTGRQTTAATYQTGIYTTVDGKLRISLDKQAGSTADIRLKGTDGAVLFTQHLGKNENQYRTRLNLSELPDGVYQVEITNGVDVKTHTVTISTKQPTTTSRLVAIN